MAACAWAALAPVIAAIATSPRPPAMIASSRDFHAYRAAAHLPGELVPIVRANHFTILDELCRPDSVLTRAVVRMTEHGAA